MNRSEYANGNKKWEQEIPWIQHDDVNGEGNDMLDIIINWQYGIWKKRHFRDWM